VIEEWSTLGQIALHPCGGTFSNWQHPAFPALALANDQRAGGGFVIAMVEMAHFTAPNAGGVEKFEHRAITQAKGIGWVGDSQQPRDFLGIERFG
jgi:hypothetical protein